MRCYGIVETGLFSGSYYNVACSARCRTNMTLISYLTENTMCCDYNERRKQCWKLTHFFGGMYSMPNLAERIITTVV